MKIVFDSNVGMYEPFINIYVIICKTDNTRHKNKLKIFRISNLNKVKNRQNHLFSLCFDSDKVISHTDDTDRWRYHYHIIPLTLVNGRDSSHIDYASPDLSPKTTQSVDVEPSPGQRPGCLRRLVIRFPGAHFRFRMCCCCCLWRC